MTTRIYRRFRTLKTLVFTAGVLLGAAGASGAVSFDCKKSATPVEKLICATPELSQLDDQMAALYKKAVAASAAVKQQQIRWLKEQRNVCQDAACLKDAYQKRIQELQASQPLSRVERKKWYAKLGWSTECEDGFDATMEGASDDDFGGVAFYPLREKTALIEVQCDLGAYQHGYIYLRYDEIADAAELLEFTRYERAEDGSVSEYQESQMGGTPSFDAANKTLTMYSKSRGIGDCGSLITYRFDDDAPAVVEARAHACSDNPKEEDADTATWEKIPAPE